MSLLAQVSKTTRASEGPIVSRRNYVEAGNGYLLKTRRKNINKKTYLWCRAGHVGV